MEEELADGVLAPKPEPVVPVPKKPDPAREVFQEAVRESSKEPPAREEPTPEQPSEGPKRERIKELQDRILDLLKGGEMGSRDLKIKLFGKKPKSGTTENNDFLDAINGIIYGSGNRVRSEGFGRWTKYSLAEGKKEDEDTEAEEKSTANMMGEVSKINFEYMKCLFDNVSKTYDKTITKNRIKSSAALSQCSLTIRDFIELMESAPSSRSIVEQEVGYNFEVVEDGREKSLVITGKIEGEDQK